MVLRWCVRRSPREVRAACKRPGASVSGSGITFMKQSCNKSINETLIPLLRKGGLVAAAHLRFHAARKPLDFLGLLNHIERQYVFIALVNVLLKLGGKLQQFVG